MTTDDTDFVNLPEEFEPLAFNGVDGEMQAFSVFIAGDNFIEGDDQFELSLDLIESVEDVFVFPEWVQTVTIKNDDFVWLTVSGPPSINESAGTATFIVKFEAPVLQSGQPIGFEGGFTANVVVTPIGHAAKHAALPFGPRDDFNVAPTTVTFTGASSESIPITVTLNDDEFVEADEDLRIGVTSPALEGLIGTVQSQLQP